MKANEVPEKIYINSNLEDRTWLFGKSNTSFIEYTRTDAFIEKAIEWLKKSITNNLECNRIISKQGTITMGLLIEDFKNYMRGNSYGTNRQNSFSSGDK